MDLNSLLNSNNRHSEELKKISESKNSILSQARLKQEQNNKIFASIQNLSEDFAELDSMLTTDHNASIDSDLTKEISSLKQDYQEFQQQLALKKQLCQINNIEKICEEIEKIHDEIVQSASKTSVLSSPIKSPEDLNSKNLPELKKSIDKNQEGIIKYEQEFSKEYREIEDLRKEIESLMKIKHLKEFEIKTLIKREEHERKVHDKHLEQLSEQKSVYRSIQASKNVGGLKDYEKTEVFSQGYRMENKGEKSEIVNSLILMMFGIVLLVGICYCF